jgi:hypothetical protein
MEQWTSLSPILGIDLEFNFMIDFFAWWRRKLIIIDEFLYVGVDFQGSVDFVLLEGIDWDVSSKKIKSFHMFFFLKIILFLCVQRGILIDVLIHHADRGTSCPTKILTLGCHGDVKIDVDHEVVVGGSLGGWEEPMTSHYGCLTSQEVRNTSTSAEAYNRGSWEFEPLASTSAPFSGVLLGAQRGAGGLWSSIYF